MSNVQTGDTGRYKRCELCTHLILDHQSRVLYPPGTAHRVCRDLRKKELGDVDFNTEFLAGLESVPKEPKKEKKNAKPNKSSK